MKTQRAVLAGATLLFLAVSVYAHHPFAADYDWTKTVTITGTVSKLEWMNPHSSLYVDGKDASGQIRQWILEMGGPSDLTRAGWSSKTLKKGDQVTVEAWMARHRNDKANVKSVKLSDGRELSGASSITDIRPTKNKPQSE